MKKLLIGSFLLAVLFLQFCTSSKNAAKTPPPPPKMTYAANIEQTIVANCSPCHIPPKGFKMALNTYIQAKNNIDDILMRIQKNPGDKGFMPFKHQRLPDSTIHVFVQWKADGLLEQ